MAVPVELGVMAAVPREIEIDGKAYKLSPLTIGQFASFEAWAKEQPFLELRKKLLAIADLALSEEARNKLVAAADEASRNPRMIAETMESFAGIVFRLKLALRTYQPKITDAEIDKILGAEGLQAITKILNALAGLDGKAKAGAGEETPAKKA